MSSEEVGASCWQGPAKASQAVTRLGFQRSERQHLSTCPPPSHLPAPVLGLPGHSLDSSRPRQEPEVRTPAISGLASYSRDPHLMHVKYPLMSRAGGEQGPSIGWTPLQGKGAQPTDRDTQNVQALGWLTASQAFPGKARPPERHPPGRSTPGVVGQHAPSDILIHKSAKSPWQPSLQPGNQQRPSPASERRWFLHLRLVGLWSCASSQQGRRTERSARSYPPQNDSPVTGMGGGRCTARQSRLLETISSSPFPLDEAMETCPGAQKQWLGPGFPGPSPALCHNPQGRLSPWNWDPRPNLPDPCSSERTPLHFYILGLMNIWPKYSSKWLMNI